MEVNYCIVIILVKQKTTLKILDFPIYEVFPINKQGQTCQTPEKTVHPSSFFLRMSVGYSYSELEDDEDLC